MVQLLLLLLLLLSNNVIRAEAVDNDTDDSQRQDLEQLASLHQELDHHQQHQDHPLLEPWQQCQTIMAPSGEGLGWGVFAVRSFQAGEIVEMAPGIIPLEAESPAIIDSALFDYTYGYYRIVSPPGHRPLVQYMQAVMLGMGEIFNHHPTAPNLAYTTFGREPDSEVPNAANAIGFRALRDIAVGEELFSTYGKEDGGKDWFSRRRLDLQHPKLDERRINITDLPAYKHLYCSKIAAGLGRSTWNDRIRPLLPPPSHVPFWIDAQWLPPTDAEIGSAFAKVDIKEGERIEWGTGMIVSQRRHLKGTALEDLAIHWEDLELDHQESLRVLRGQGQWTLQVNEWLTDSSWIRLDGFTSWEDVAILPMGGNIGLVDRRRPPPPPRGGGDSAPSTNCRLVIPTTITTTTTMQQQSPADPAVMISLHLMATRDIPTGERLWLNIPYPSDGADSRTQNVHHHADTTTSPDPVAQLHHELKMMGRLPPDDTRYGIPIKETSREEL